MTRQKYGMNIYWVIPALQATYLQSHYNIIIASHTRGLLMVVQAILQAVAIARHQVYGVLQLWGDGVADLRAPATVMGFHGGVDASKEPK